MWPQGGEGGQWNLSGPPQTTIESRPLERRSLWESRTWWSSATQTASRWSSATSSTALTSQERTGSTLRSGSGTGRRPTGPAESARVTQGPSSRPMGRSSMTGPWGLVRPRPHLRHQMSHHLHHQMSHHLHHQMSHHLHHHPRTIPPSHPRTRRWSARGGPLRRGPWPHRATRCSSQILPTPSRARATIRWTRGAWTPALWDALETRAAGSATRSQRRGVGRPRSQSARSACVISGGRHFQEPASSRPPRPWRSWDAWMLALRTSTRPLLWMTGAASIKRQALFLMGSSGEPT